MLLLSTSSALPPITSAGIDKNTNQQLSRNVWTYLTNWAVRSGYPGTVLSSNSLVVDGSGTVQISAQVNWTGNDFDDPRGFRVLLDGSVIWTVTTSADGPISGVRQQQVSAGQRLTMQAYSDRLITGNRVVAGGSSNTFLYYQNA
jgi:hypothetical protein